MQHAASLMPKCIEERRVLDERRVVSASKKKETSRNSEVSQEAAKSELHTSKNETRNFFQTIFPHFPVQDFSHLFACIFFASLQQCTQLLHAHNILLIYNQAAKMLHRARCKR